MLGKITIAQENFSIGDFGGNLAKIKRAILQSIEYQSELIIFPECAVCGYSAEDLLLHSHFIEACEDSINKLVAFSQQHKNCPAIIIGSPYYGRYDGSDGGDSYISGNNTIRSESDVFLRDGDSAKPHNCAFFIQSGQVRQVFYKNFLPNFDVFDEKRIFTTRELFDSRQSDKEVALTKPKEAVIHKPHIQQANSKEDEASYNKADGNFGNLLKFKDATLAILICEDFWQETTYNNLRQNYSSHPTFEYPSESASESSCDGSSACGFVDYIIAINASPFQTAKHASRLQFAKKITASMNAGLIYVNLVGGQDELVFDGNSFIMDKSGDLIFQAEAFKNASYNINLANLKKEVEMAEAEAEGKPLPKTQDKTQDKTEEDNQQIYSALVLAMQDYVRKNGFQSVCLGVSGGIDSAIVATIATDALGSNNVYPFMLASKYTSDHSLQDASELCHNLKLSLQNLPIEPPVLAIESCLEPVFNKKRPHKITDSNTIATTDITTDVATDTTAENIQSRIRGLLLMAISNKFGHLLLSTGNKSELSVGYATLYGDMNGAFNPIKDVYKSKIFELCHWRNKNAPNFSLYQQKQVIPHNIIIKPPSAELKQDQKDEDSLPAYDILDEILHNLIEQRKSPAKIIEEIAMLAKTSNDEATIKKYEIFKQEVNNIAHLLKISEYKRNQACIGVKISGCNFGKGRRIPITNNFF